MRGALEELPLAVFDDGVLLHLGDPLGEQRLLERGDAVAALGDRAVVAVAGDDRLTWLDTLSSQALARLEAGESSELLLLDPQGRVEHAAGVVDDGETAWLFTDAGDAEALAAWLVRMRFRLRVEPRDASAEFLVLGGTAQAVRAAAAAAAIAAPVVWTDPWPAVAAGGWGYAPEPHPAAARDWAELLVPAAAIGAVADAARAGGIRIVGSLAADALRIAARRPRRAAEVDERTVPHEVDWLRTAVHLSKGCYRGQETVAKVHNLGHPPRRLVALQLDGSDGALPSPGDAVLSADTEVGHVTSAARHFEEGPIALAVIRRTTPLEATLTVATADGALAAAQEVVVPPDAGAAASVPRLPRLGRRTG